MRSDVTTGGVASMDRLEAIHERMAVLAGQINAAQAEITALAAEVERDELLGGTGLRSTAAWLEWQLGAAPGTAKQLVRVARRRDELPASAEAFDAGALSFDAVAAIANRVDAAHDEHFAGFARLATVRQLRTAIRASVPVDVAEPSAGDAPTNTLWTRSDGAGRWMLHIESDEITGARIETAIDQFHRPLLEAHRRGTSAGDDGDDPPRWPTRFDAFTELLEAAQAADAARRPWDQRTKLVIHHHRRDDGGHVGAGDANVHLGPAVSERVRRELSCDAVVEHVGYQDGRPVDVGREHRLAPPRTRLVVEARDGGCVICGATSGPMIIHHLQHWEDDGPTDTENLVTLCPADHHRTHAGKVLLVGNPNLARGTPGALAILDPERRPLRPPEPRPQSADASGHRTPPTLRRFVHPTGERIDWDLYEPPPTAPAPPPSPVQRSEEAISDPDMIAVPLA